MRYALRRTPLRAPHARALEIQGRAHLRRTPLEQNPAINWGVRIFGRACGARAPNLQRRRGIWKFQTSAAILVWRYRGSQEEGWTRRFHWDRTLIICYPLHEHYMFTNTHVGSQSMITLLNNTQGLKIIENTFIFFVSELLGEVSNFEGGSTLYRSSTTKNLRALSLIFTESQSKQFCSYLWTSDICVSVH